MSPTAVTAANVSTGRSRLLAMEMITFAWNAERASNQAIQLNVSAAVSRGLDGIQ